MKISVKSVTEIVHTMYRVAYTCTGTREGVFLRFTEHDNASQIVDITVEKKPLKFVVLKK